MPNEFESVSYRRIQHLNILFNNIIYRNYHLHGEFELLCLIRGEAQIGVRGEAHRAERGSVFLFNRNEPHEIHAPAGADFAVVQISRQMLSDYFPAFRTTVFHQTDVTGAMDADTRRGFWNTLYRLCSAYLGGNSHYELDCVCETATLLKQLYETVPHTVYGETAYPDERRAMRRANRILEYIHENADGKLSLSELAESEDLTPTYLSHFFRERFGISFQEYAANVRFEQALRLIADPRLSLWDVAAQSGFSDVKYMSRMFRKRFGCTPREYARTMTKELPSGKQSLSEYHYSHEESLMLLETFVQPLAESKGFFPR